MNGSFYDRVIPNYFDPEDITFSADKGNYYLFIGRIIKRKGIMTAIKACNAMGKKLLIVGQGGRVEADGSLHDDNPEEFRIGAGTWEYLGYADFAKRKELMAHAIATFTPTEYLECFAGTHVESMLSGTPVLTTNFGVFPGTVVNGVNGYKCDTLDDFVHYAQEAAKLNPATVWASAARYLMDNVKWEYQKWFEDIMAVYESAQDGNLLAWHRIWSEPREWQDHMDW
jgi:glycosyltransferase involved in cell wall biosynthesis